MTCLSTNSIEPGGVFTPLCLFVDHIADLSAASQSSTVFWDNPLDDDDWNNA